MLFKIYYIPQLAEDGLNLKNALSEFSDLVGDEVTDQFVSENNPLVVAGNQLLHSSGTETIDIENSAYILIVYCRIKLLGAKLMNEKFKIILNYRLCDILLTFLIFCVLL